jgi:hypothetical protein
MIKNNIQCSLAGLGKTMALWLKDDASSMASWALDIAGSGRTTMLWTRGQPGSSVSRTQELSGVHSVAGSGRTTLLRAWERCRGLGDEACVVDSATDLGREDGGA